MSMLRGPLAGLCAAALMTAAAGGVATAQESLVLRSADTHPDGYPTVEAVEYMSQLLGEKTGGRLSIQVFHSSQLGEEKDTIEQTQFGVLDMNRVNLAPLNQVAPETVVLGLPFLFRSVEHMHEVLDGEIGQQILDAMEPHGLIGLAFYDSGARSVYNSKRPVTSIADMNGLKVRVQQSDLFIAMIQALGANPTPMPFGEVYSGLQTGVVDGAENNWPSYHSTRHFEVAPYYSLTEHSMTPEMLVMSKLTWDRLTPEDQQAVRDAAKESVARMRELWQVSEEEARAAVVDGGAQVNEVDKQPFIDAMQPVYDRFASDPKLKDLVERIRAVE
ncbi:MAG TPA: TRAP transporter substrate-binding protein [Geminicoccaceae bacterium]|nr:TRAP transporter substrate-binding protein [Geminicoccaceae bacterium]